MTPDQFLASLEKNGAAPVYLFLGPEPYQRERCRRALLDAVLGTAPEDRDSGLTRVDLSEVPLAAALDDARALSLFASQRVIWIGSAEAVLPRGRAAAAESDETGDAGDADQLSAYLREPTPGTVVVLESSRYGFEGEDKARIERVQKYFAAIPAQVEFRPFSPEAARSLAQTLAKTGGVAAGIGGVGTAARRHRRRRVANRGGDRETALVHRRLAQSDGGRYRGAGAGRASHHHLRAGRGTGARRPHARARNSGYAWRAKASTCRWP